tara:strand:+ start:1377 stop:1697 length:321 start_codon:yes stop_codon:yes gene_type:complete
MAKIDKYIKELIQDNNLVVLRDKRTHKALGVSYTEDGLRSIGNKLGVYVYCKGRVTDFGVALGAPKSEKVYVEKFVPRDFDNKLLTKCEIHWVNAAKYKLYSQSKY